MKRFSFLILSSILFTFSLHSQVTTPSLSGRAGGGSASVLVGTNLNLHATARTAAVLKAGTDGLGFYPVTTTTSIKANTAYVPENKQLLIDLATLDSPMTGIQATEMVNGKLSDVKCYDLSGREVVNVKQTAGIIVQNKKKLIVQP